MGLQFSANDSSSFVVRSRRYRIVDIIGQGGEATVYQCKNRWGKRYAVKVFYFSRYPRFQIPQRIDGFKREANILRYLSGRSKHFIRLIDYEYRSDENVGYMVMELGDGNLRQYLQGRPLSYSLRKTFWKQIVEILTALEDAHIVHADIKPENMILVDGMLKLTDLGLAFRLLSTNQFLQRPLVRGTLDYMAPEVFSHQTGFKSDIWSAGIILYEMTYGRPPYFFIFDREQKIASISSMMPINFPLISDYDLLDILQTCLMFDSRYRPSAHHLRIHPFTTS